MYSMYFISFFRGFLTDTELLTGTIVNIEPTEGLTVSTSMGDRTCRIPLSEISLLYFGTRSPASALAIYLLICGMIKDMILGLDNKCINTYDQLSWVYSNYCMIVPRPHGSTHLLDVYQYVYLWPKLRAGTKIWRWKHCLHHFSPCSTIFILLFQMTNLYFTVHEQIKNQVGSRKEVYML